MAVNEETDPLHYTIMYLKDISYAILGERKSSVRVSDLGERRHQLCNFGKIEQKIEKIKRLSIHGRREKTWSEDRSLIVEASLGCSVLKGRRRGRVCARP